MATIQAKTSRGHKYWYIVESRRVNGKPRPIVLAYLGKAEQLLRRLQGLREQMRVKSYSHGAVAALLQGASELDLPARINRFIASPRRYVANKPLRNHLTAGITLVLGGIGRVCMPTSKRGWWTWARTTSCEYLLGVSLAKVDSQHFWDLMDALPCESIEKIENELLQETFTKYGLEGGTLFFDTTNFFTYIATTNTRCTIARRGKNKQKRHDLRQTGLALVVTREDMIPVFHVTYQGNLSDTEVFASVVGKVKQRMRDLGMDIEKQTFVFDRGNNSKKNLAALNGLHYVGALTPYQHQKLIEDAEANLQEVVVGRRPVQAFRDRRVIWGEERTVIVFVSDQLKAGQIRGIYQSLEKVEKDLNKLREVLSNPKARKRDKGQLERSVQKLLDRQYARDVISASVCEAADGRLSIIHSIDRKKLQELEDDMGFRILMTNRHDWPTSDIIDSYHGQCNIEQVFKNLKNPYHLALKPQFHWTDQKIIVHNFICVLGYLLAALVWRQARRALPFGGTLDTLLDTLNNVRLATLLEMPPAQGRPKVTYQLEEMSQEEARLVEGLQIADLHRNRPQLRGVGVYD